MHKAVVVAQVEGGGEHDEQESEGGGVMVMTVTRGGDVMMCEAVVLDVNLHISVCVMLQCSQHRARNETEFE